MISLDVEDSIARITLANAEQRNAIGPEWLGKFAWLVRRLRERDDYRVVVIDAEGPTFTVGGDIQHFVEHMDTLPAEFENMIGTFHEQLGALAELPIPVVVAARGAIAGGGLGLLWCADLILLADDAVLATGFAKIGISGDGGSTWYLPRMLGTRRALRLQLHGDVLDAQAALAWDLADHVVPAAELSEAASVAARSLRDGPTVAYGEIRQLVRQAFGRTLADGLEAERHAMVRCSGTADVREGVAAFLERRPPNFSGS